MENPLSDVPLNTKQIYVRAIAPCGCKVYMPVDSDEMKEHHKKRDGLLAWLNEQHRLNLKPDAVA